MHRLAISAVSLALSILLAWFIGRNVRAAIASGRVVNLLVKRWSDLPEFERIDSPWAYWSTLWVWILLGVMVEVFLVAITIVKVMRAG